MNKSPEAIRRSFEFATETLVLSEEEAIQAVAEAFRVNEKTVRQAIEKQAA